MTLARLRPRSVAVLGLLAIAPIGCAVEGGGYGGGYGYPGGYYEPYGYDYGGWGEGYRGGHGDHGGSHAYRPAPSSHGIPSIPSGSRGGGGAHGGRSR